jgi:hypothetical protein
MNNRIAAIREKRLALQVKFPNGDCVVVSVANELKATTAGHFFEVPVSNAAQLLTDGTHRIASEDEAGDFYKAQDAARARVAPMDTLERARARFTH